MMKFRSALLSAVVVVCSGLATARAQDGKPTDAAQPQAAPKTGGFSKDTTSKSPKTGSDPESASKPATIGNGEEAASTVKLDKGALDVANAPKDLPKGRPVIGLAMGGGAALAMSEIGVIEWMEEHRVPVDVIAGTSMGSILSALYSTGHTPKDMKHILTGDSVTRVFAISADYTHLSYRRREDARELPNAIGVGLRHGPSLRNSILTDTGLNELLDREFLRYNDQTDFNELPIPFRCQATDLNAAKTVTFSRGSLQNAVRASASIPGVFRPFELDGHEYVDGAILQNLPTADVKAMKADIIIAISLPLEPVGKGDLNSILGVLQRAFSVGIEANEARDRKLANILIMPDISGFTANDYLKTDELALKGYLAAEQHKAELMPLALSPQAWSDYIAHRKSKERPAAGTVLQVKVKAPNQNLTDAVNRMFQPMVNQPVDLDQVESLLADVRSDGRYDADYTVGYDSAKSDRPILLVAVNDKKNGPPFLELGANIEAQSGGITRASLDTIFLWQDLGGYGSGFRARADVGFSTRLDGEYYRKLTWSGIFAAGRAGIARQPYYIYNGANYRVAERQYQEGGVGADAGWSDGRKKELRAGWSYQNIGWNTTTGNDGAPNYNGASQRVRGRFVYDSQDRALVPRFGIRSETQLGYLYSTPSSPSTPYFQGVVTAAHTLDAKNTLLVKGEGGTLFNTNVQQPFRYTLGGPLRLSSLAIDQLRGTDYFLVAPGYLRRIATLPSPLGQSIFVGATYEAGQMRAPDMHSILRQSISIGIVAETPLGVITLSPSIGDGGNRKFNFTLGKLF